MFIGVLSACMSVWGYQKPWNYSYRQMRDAMWVVGLEPRVSRRATTKPSLQPSQWFFFKSNLKNLTQDHEESHLCFLLRVLSLELVNLGLCTELIFVLWLCSSLISFFYMWIRGCPNTVWSSTIVLESLCELATLKGFTFVISILLPWSTC